LLDSFHTLLILNGEKAVQLDYLKLNLNDYQFNLKLLFDLSGETLQFKAISASAAGSIAEIIIRDFYVNISVSTDNFAVILEEIKLNFSGQGSFYADIFEKDPDKFNIYASVTSPQGYINVKHFLLQITEFVLIEINDLNIQGKTIVSLYGHGTLLTNKKPSDIDYELRLAVNSPYWSLGRFHLEAFIFGYNKFFTFEQVTGNGEITLGLADWATEFGLPQFMIVGVNGDFDWEHLIFYPDLLVAMGLLNESWRGVPIDSQHGSINGHIDLYIDFPNLIYGAVGNLTFKIVAYETTFIDILKYSIKGSYVSFINLEFHEGQGSISWHIPALYVFDYEENPKNTFEVRGSGTLNPKIGVCRVVNSKYNIDFTVSNLTLHIPYFLIELDAEKDITPETYLFIDTNNQYCEVNFEIVDLIKVFGVNFRTEDLRIDFDVDGDYEGFVRITNQNAEITGLSIEIFNHWKIFATGGWGNYAELTWNTDGNGVGTITLDTNNEPFHFDFLIMRILQIKGGFTAEDLVCDFDLNADGVGYIEVNDGTAVLDEFTWFLFIKWTISGSLPKHGKLEWNIDGDFNGHIFIDTDNENLEWTIYIYDRILCSGSFKAQDKLIEWDWTGHSIIPFHRSGTISFNPGEFEAAVCIQGDWYNILGGFDDLPVADAGGPYNGKINEVVTLDGSGSYSQSGADLEYRWDYDNDMWWDTDWSDSPTYEVAYSEAGEYEITLQVREKNSIFKQDQDTTTATILKSGMGTITGKVLDLDDYSPIRGATVETEDGNSTVTDADGNYELVVPYGDHTITASKDGYSTESKERYVPDGGSIEVYFHLQNLSNCYIQGFVYDASTGPGYDGIGDATVIANPGDYSVKTMNIGTSIGYYRIDLPPGTYTVTASKDGYQTRTEKNVVVPPGGYVSPLNFYLPPEATCIEGHVYDDENNPVSYATVATSEGSTKTNSKGYYLLEVSPGYQTVTASKDGYQSQSKNVNAIEGQTVTQDFILNRLEAEIFGFVKDSSTGHAISGVYVHTFSIDGATYSDYTDSNGFYSLTVIPNQGYTVAAEAEGYTAISHYVEENDLQDGSEQCNFELDPFTAGWRSPTGHSDPSNGWNDEYMAYDGNLNWAANSNNAGSNSWEWTSFLQLTLYEAIKCNKVRFYAYYNSQRCSKIDLDVYYSNAWHDCYEGSFASKQWVEKSVPGGEKSISKARVRFYIRKYLGINTRADLYEFEFYESGSGNGDGGDDDGGGGDTCCFPAGTMITMADGSLKPIENVKIGEYVLSYDIQSSQLTTCKVLETVSPIRDGVYNINNGLIQPTDDHPLFVKKTDGTTGWAAINPAHAESGYNMKPMQLEIGDKLLTSNGRWITIYSIEYTPGKIQTYNLEDVSGESNFFANGLLVHNATDCYEPSPGSDHNVE